MKTNEDIDKYLIKNIGCDNIDPCANKTYFDDYTGTVIYTVNYNDIMDKYFSAEENSNQFFGMKKPNGKRLKFSFECEKATFGITEEGFVDWKSGVFLHGDFVGDFNGIWKTGNFHLGNFNNGVWESGNFNGELFQKSIWKNGIWSLDEKIFKTNKKPIFMDSIWENGVWLGGNFINSTWLNGRWKNGKFIKSQWINGVWDGGDFMESAWIDGNWLGGEIKDDSIWLAGPFSFHDQFINEGKGKYTINNKPNNFNYMFRGEKTK